MRWTIPTLIDTLYRNGLDINLAATIVTRAYAVTQGDESFYWGSFGDPASIIVGPYALYEVCRGLYPSDAPTHAGADARTIVAALRAPGADLHEIVDLSFPSSPMVDDAVSRAVSFIQAGGIVQATTIDDSAAQLQASADLTDRVARQAAIVGPLFDTMFRQ